MPMIIALLVFIVLNVLAFRWLFPKDEPAVCPRCGAPPTRSVRLMGAVVPYAYYQCPACHAEGWGERL
jgi:formate dehydrogenase maturation protein FdhE